MTDVRTPRLDDGRVCLLRVVVSSIRDDFASYGPPRTSYTITDSSVGVGTFNNARYRIDYFQPPDLISG